MQKIFYNDTNFKHFLHAFAMTAVEAETKTNQGITLTHFSPMFHFYNLWKRQKIFGFLTFSGGIEMEQWAKTGSWDQRLTGYSIFETLAQILHSSFVNSNTNIPKQKSFSVFWSCILADNRRCCRKQLNLKYW